MKSKLLYLCALISCVLVSCSTNNEVTDTDSGIATSYFPLKNANWWTYKVQTAAPGFLRDSLYVKGDTIIAGITYKKMNTRFTPNGFFSTTLKNNGIRIDGSSIKLAGSVSFTAGLPSPIVFTVSDLAIFKENAVQDDLIGSTSGTFQQTIQGYPLTFTYILSTYFDGSLASFTTTTNKSYTDLKKMKVVLNLKITYVVPGIGFTATVLQPQNVVVSTQYYAKTKGMVYANTDINYTLSSVPGFTLPIPSSGSQNQKEYLDLFLIN